jgi:hypothetical protein
MNKTPDWLIGGDPLRTVWTGNREHLSIENILWSPLGQWVDEVHELNMESGTTANGTVVAVRLRGVIMETARELSGEFGWCVPENQILEIPVMIPSEWSEPWRSWLYGDVSNSELFSKLGLSDGSPGVGVQTFRIASQKITVSTRSQSKSHFVWLIAALSLGFALGWLIRPCAAPSDVRLAPHKINSVESNNEKALVPEKPERPFTNSENHVTPPKSKPPTPADR